jgi:thioredoxin reductase
MAEIAADALKNLVADTIVIAAGSTPNTDLADKLKGVKVQSIGDCTEPRRIIEAMREGWKAALEI